MYVFTHRVLPVLALLALVILGIQVFRNLENDPFTAQK